MEGEGGQEEGCLHFGEVKGGCGVIDDCEVSVGEGQGLVGEEALSNRKGVESRFLSLKIALHFSVT